MPLHLLLMSTALYFPRKIFNRFDKLFYRDNHSILVIAYNQRRSCICPHSFRFIHDISIAPILINLSLSCTRQLGLKLRRYASNFPRFSSFRSHHTHTGLILMKEANPHRPINLLNPAPLISRDCCINPPSGFSFFSCPPCPIPLTHC